MHSHSGNPESGTPHCRIQEWDVAIIGAGPSGLYGAYYAGFRGLSVVVCDSLHEPGGQISALYPEKEIFDVAGYVAVKGQQLVDTLVAQADRWKPVWRLGAAVVELTEESDRVRLRDSRGEEFFAKTVLICGGVGTFTPRELPTGSDFHGRGLHYFVPKLNALAGLDVVVVGGGDSAVDWALGLDPLAKSVSLVHRRDQFRAHARSVEQLRDSNVCIYTPHEVVEVRGDDHVYEVVIESKSDKQRITLPAQALVAALGFIADLGPMEAWGLDLLKRRILVDRAMRTNLPRVFAAGDISDYEAKVCLISVGFGEAAAAVNNLAPLARPELSTVPGHSSDTA